MAVMTMNMAHVIMTGTQACFHQLLPRTHDGATGNWLLSAGSTALRQEKENKPRGTLFLVKSAE